MSCNTLLTINSATNDGKLLKRRFLFNIHAYLFDILLQVSLVGCRILLTDGVTVRALNL